MAWLPAQSPAMQAALSGKTKGTFTEAPAQSHIWSVSGQRNMWGGNESVHHKEDDNHISGGLGRLAHGHRTARRVVLDASIIPSKCHLQRARQNVPARALTGLVLGH